MSGMKPLILRRAATGSPSRKREQSYESNIFVTVEITKTGLQDRPTYRLHLGISIQNNGSVWEIGLETAISAKVFFAEPQANESIDPEIRDVASPPGIPFTRPLHGRLAWKRQFLQRCFSQSRKRMNPLTRKFATLLVRPVYLLTTPYSQDREAQVFGSSECWEKSTIVPQLQGQKLLRRLTA